MYFDQLLLAARKVHVVYFNQLLGAAHYIHFISNHDIGMPNMSILKQLYETDLLFHKYTSLINITSWL